MAAHESEEQVSETAAARDGPGRFRVLEFDGIGADLLPRELSGVPDSNALSRGDQVRRWTLAKTYLGRLAANRYNVNFTLRLHQIKHLGIITDYSGAGAAEFQANVLGGAMQCDRPIPCSGPFHAGYSSGPLGPIHWCFL